MSLTVRGGIFRAVSFRGTASLSLRDTLLYTQPETGSSHSAMQQCISFGSERRCILYDAHRAGKAMDHLAALTDAVSTWMNEAKRRAHDERREVRAKAAHALRIINAGAWEEGVAANNGQYLGPKGKSDLVIEGLAEKVLGSITAGEVAVKIASLAEAVRKTLLLEGREGDAHALFTRTLSRYPRKILALCTARLGADACERLLSWEIMRCEKCLDASLPDRKDGRLVIFACLAAGSDSLVCRLDTNTPPMVPAAMLRHQIRKDRSILPVSKMLRRYPAGQRVLPAAAVIAARYYYMPRHVVHPMRVTHDRAAYHESKSYSCRITLAFLVLRIHWSMSCFR